MNIIFVQPTTFLLFLSFKKNKIFFAFFKYFLLVSICMRLTILKGVALAV